MKKQTVKALMDIGKRMPQNLIDDAMVEKPLTPTLHKMAQKAIESDKVKDSVKEGMQNMLDAGKFSRTYVEIDKKKAKLADKWMEKEIAKAIKSGKLPDPKKDDDIKKFYKKIWKGKNKASETK